MIPAGVRKWLAFGSGVGIEIFGPHGSESLRICAVRVRPSGARIVGGFTIEDVTHQPAGIWGTDYAAFLRRLGLRHLVATVLLPRQDLIVRQINLPGVADQDLAAAVEFQMDGLHPYPEDDVTSSWARLPGTSTVVIAIARRAAIDRYATLFAEAGIKIGAFTCSAAAIYSSLRLFGAAPAPAILAFDRVDDHVEFYGESPARPLFSASFEAEEDRAGAMACAELRIDPGTEPRPLQDLVSAAPAPPYVAALASACPRLFLPLNLLPKEQRQASSRVLWIPASVFGAVALMLAGALVAFPGYENRRYLRSLQAEIAKIEPRASRVAALDAQVEAVRRSTLVLDDFRRRAKADMDVLNEMTRILPPSTWLNMIEITRNQVILVGEADQAAPLLKVIDASPLFEASEFTTPPNRIQNGEMFRIRTLREAPKQ
jgi:Tfp pilus assembly protein PilN